MPYLYLLIMQNNRKMHLNYKTMILFPQNELQNILGNTIYAVPGGQIHPFFTKKYPNYWYYPNKYLIWTIRSCKVRIKIHSEQSMMVFLLNKLKTIGGNSLYGHLGGQISKCWPKMNPNIGIMQIIPQVESPNLDHLIIQTQRT